MEGNTATSVAPIVSADAVTAIGTTLQSNISTVAPAILGVMAVTIVAGVIFKFIRRNTGK